MSTDPHALVTQEAGPSFDLLGMDRQIRRRIVRERVLRAAFWMGLVAIGLRTRGVLGWLGAGAGSLALVRELSVWNEERPEWQRQRGSGRGPWLRRLLRSDHSDLVDQASTTSFPASDAPSLPRG
jgi:hypothetical protein